MKTVKVERLAAAAAGGAAGARRHSREHEALALMEINVRGHQHLTGLLLQKNLEAVQLEGRVALQGSFGYVHSQRRASAARDREDPHPVSRYSLFCNHILELLYRAVRQTYHYFLLESGYILILAMLKSIT